MDMMTYRMSCGKGEMSAADVIYARLDVDGRNVVCLSECGFGSIGDVVGWVRRMAGRFAGMARLLVRNQSRGWQVTLPLRSVAGDGVGGSSAPAELCRPMCGNQYLIPWPQVG